MAGTTGTTRPEASRWAKHCGKRSWDSELQDEKYGVIPHCDATRRTPAESWGDLTHSSPRAFSQSLLKSRNFYQETPIMKWMTLTAALLMCAGASEANAGLFGGSSCCAPVNSCCGGYTQSCCAPAAPSCCKPRCGFGDWCKRHFRKRSCCNTCNTCNAAPTCCAPVAPACAAPAMPACAAPVAPAACAPAPHCAAPVAPTCCAPVAPVAASCCAPVAHCAPKCCAPRTPRCCKPRCHRVRRCRSNCFGNSNSCCAPKSCCG